MSNAAVKMGWTIQSLAQKVSKIVQEKSGNVLGQTQSSMVESRLMKRLLDLGRLTPDEYNDYLEKNLEAESLQLVSILTTHHTFFFREFVHFEFIEKNLETLVKNMKARGDNCLKILSAACSKGHEAYSLAMFLYEHLKAYPGVEFQIVGTDIDPESVKMAQNGVYRYSEVKSIPQLYLSNNWQRGTGEIADFAKIKKHLKDRCSFKVMNLLESQTTLGAEKFDIILCRNVLIYFEHKTIEKIVPVLKENLHRRGVFISGLSESLKHFNFGAQTLAPSVYSFDDFVTAAEVPKNVANLPQKAKVIRVLSVDDSPVVLKLMTKIFETDPNFELVGTAKNGLEAEEFLKKNKVDVMTLDIHMPKMDGVEYLKKNHNASHPPVLMISSASRDDMAYAQEALKNGAKDFVEKPQVQNLNDASAEIKAKLKTLAKNTTTTLSSIDREFKHEYKIDNLSNKARVIIGEESGDHRIQTIINDLSKKEQPPIFVFTKSKDVELASKIKKLKVSNFKPGLKLEPNTVYICEQDRDFGSVFRAIEKYKVNVSILKEAHDFASNNLILIRSHQIFLEETPNILPKLAESAKDIFPWTSFAHLGTEFLSEDS